MNKHGWYDELWNPITGTPKSEIRTGIKNHCCRFSGDVRYNLSMTDKYIKHSQDYYILEKPFKSYSSDKNFIVAPFGTYPTLHKYRYNTPSKKYLTGRTLFVNPFADTFLMPTEWIQDVFIICNENPQHNFVFFVDNPSDFSAFICEHKNLTTDNMWFGYFFNEDTKNAIKNNFIQLESGHIFLNTYSLTDSFLDFLKKYPEYVKRLDWILVDYQMKQSNLSNQLNKIVADAKLPVYFDNNRSDLPHDLPKELSTHTVSTAKKSLQWAKCANCGAENPKNKMFRIGVTQGRNCTSNILGFLCGECYDEFKTQF